MQSIKPGFKLLCGHTIISPVVSYDSIIAGDLTWRCQAKSYIQFKQLPPALDGEV